MHGNGFSFLAMAIFPSALLSLRGAMQFVINELSIVPICVSSKQDGAILESKRTKRFRAPTKWILPMVRAKGSTRGLHADLLHGTRDETSDWSEAQGITLTLMCLAMWNSPHHLLWTKRLRWRHMEPVVVLVVERRACHHISMCGFSSRSPLA